jgi:hypothetical protein
MFGCRHFVVALACAVSCSCSIGASWTASGSQRGCCWSHSAASEEVGLEGHESDRHKRVLQAGFDNPYGMYGIRREYRAFFCGQNGNPVHFYVCGDMANGAPINAEAGEMGIPFSSQLHAIQTGTHDRPPIQIHSRLPGPGVENPDSRSRNLVAGGDRAAGTGLGLWRSVALGRGQPASAACRVMPAHKQAPDRGGGSAGCVGVSRGVPRACYAKRGYATSALERVTNMNMTNIWCAKCPVCVTAALKPLRGRV